MGITMTINQLWEASLHAKLTGEQYKTLLEYLNTYLDSEPVEKKPLSINLDGSFARLRRQIQTAKLEISILKLQMEVLKYNKPVSRWERFKQFIKGE